MSDERLRNALKIEALVDDVSARHELHSVHFFKDAGEPVWRVFGLRGEQSFRQSVEEGRGPSIAAALRNLDARLIAGPIDRPPFDLRAIDDALESDETAGGTWGLR